MEGVNFDNQRLVAIEPVENKYVSITWQVNDFCNYKCSYCNPGNWAGLNTVEYGLYEIITNMKTIIDHYQSKGYQGFKFYFSGGEPTVWKHLLPLIDWLKENIDDPHIGINTNLSRATSWWQENYHYFHDVVASFHIEFADKERYMNNLIFLQDKLNYLCSRMMMHEPQFREVIEFGELVKSKLQNYNLEWVPLFDDISVNAGPWEYSEAWMEDFFRTHSFETKLELPKPNGSKWQTASKEIFEDGGERLLNGNRLVAERRNFFKGWHCHVDESLFINQRGYISAASCGVGPQLGNIYEGVNLISDPIICSKEQCTCGTDMIISKRQPNLIVTDASNA